MDFFGHQEQARRNTRRLVVLFALAVLTIIALLYLTAVYGMHLADNKPQLQWWRLDVLWPVALGVLVVVATGSFFKTLQLKAGGPAVAKMLGGQPVLSNTDDPLERRLLNCVEEMAVASGTPVPEVFILEGQQGINAFAAGLRPTDAAVAVTRGCLEALDREQLQGVIAHEFSHIFHGDSRINVKLIGVLNGILCIAIGGRLLLEFAARGSRHSRRSSNNKGALPLLLFGVAMWIIGWIGVLFARLIKAGVSRQREFLADAAAVQYTRNPEGIAGALRAIGGFDRSRIQSGRAEEASHMFFAAAIRSGLSGAFATHPPLKDRIERIEGLPMPAAQRSASRSTPTGGAAAGMAEAVSGLAAGAGNSAPGISPESAVESVGAPTAGHLAWSRSLLEDLPLALRAASREPFSARALIHALLLDQDEDVRRRQLQTVRDHAEPEVAMQVRELASLAASLVPQARLPLVELTIPALRQLSPRQYEAFASNVRRVMEADRRSTVFEYALAKLLLRHLHQHFHPGDATQRVRHRDLASVLPAMAQMLSTLAHLGSGRDATRAYQAGLSVLGTDGMPALIAREDCSLPRLDEAITELARAHPTVKRHALLAAARTAAADGVLTAQESDLIRAFADALDCPMPPLVGAVPG